MNLTISSAVAKKYGLHAAVILSYFQHCYEESRDHKGSFAAPHPPLLNAFSIQWPTFYRHRDTFAAEGLLQIDRTKGNLNLYRLNHERIDTLTNTEN